jgi:hypothetical protein
MGKENFSRVTGSFAHYIPSNGDERLARKFIISMLSG